MNPMQCQIKNHNSSQIIVACMDKQCKNKKLCCWQCISESHSSHQKKCVEISQINDFIQQEGTFQTNRPQSLSYGQEQIIQGLEKLMTLINSLLKIVKEKIEMIKLQNLNQYLKKASNNQQGIEFWNQLIEDILQFVEVDNCHINLTKSVEGQLNSRDEQQIKSIKQFEYSLSSIINQINPSQIKIDNQNQRKSINLYFDANRKHLDFAIIDKYTITKTKSSYCTMAFANEGFDPKNQSYEFTFKIQNSSGMIIGVGNDEEVKLNSYVNSKLDKLGHGQYMIQSHCKDTYHHTDLEFNNQSKGILFMTGDNIQIKYDHVTKMLEFRKQSDQNNVTKMPISDMTKILYPCVMFHYADDYVQLAEY